MYEFSFPGHPPCAVFYGDCNSGFRQNNSQSRRVIERPKGRTQLRASHMRFCQEEHWEKLTGPDTGSHQSSRNKS